MHLHPGITPLTARSRLAARATDAKIRLWRIKHRRVQTAAVVLCRGVYVFIGRVSRVFPRGFFSCTRAVTFCSCQVRNKKKINFFIKGEPLAREWHPTHVKEILQGEYYIGNIVHITFVGTFVSSFTFYWLKY